MDNQKFKGMQKVIVVPSHSQFHGRPCSLKKSCGCIEKAILNLITAKILSCDKTNSFTMNMHTEIK